jgi:hypothetical protein
MQQIRMKRPRSRGERPWREVLPLDPRDPDVVRIKAAARARHGSASKTGSPPSRDLRKFTIVPPVRLDGVEHDPRCIWTWRGRSEAFERPLPGMTPEALTARGRDHHTDPRFSSEPQCTALRRPVQGCVAAGAAGRHATPQSRGEEHPMKKIRQATSERASRTSPRLRRAVAVAVAVGACIAAAMTGAVSASAATAPAPATYHASPSGDGPYLASQHPAGEACVFNASNGADWGTPGAPYGHVGWGFEQADGSWEYGANEGPVNAPSDMTSNTWIKDGTWDDMLADFAAGGAGYQPAGYYDSYECTAVAAVAANPSAADNEANNEANEQYSIPTQDCESHVYNVLSAYGVSGLPSDISYPAPNSWYSALTSDGFSQPTSLSSS